jgi:DNA-binding transcriptional LysR family regulator
VRERRIDLAIMRMAASAAEPDMDAEVLFQDPLAIVVGKQNPLASRRRVSLAELVNEPWTLPPASGFLGGFIVEAFRVRGLEPPRTTVITSSAQMWDNLLATGRFLGVLPSVVLSLPGRHGHLKALPIALPDTARPIGLVRARNRSLSPTAHLFIEETRSVTKHLADNTNYQRTPAAE